MFQPVKRLRTSKRPKSPRLRTSLLAALSLVLAMVALSAVPQTHAAEQNGKPEAAKTLAAEIDKLIEQLGADEFRLRELATQRLLELGVPALRALRAAAKSPDAEVRTRALRLGAAIRETLDYALAALKDPDAALRKEAAETLERLGPGAKAALPAVLEALKDKDESVRDAVFGALLSIDPTHEAIDQAVPQKARVGAKYANFKLQRRINVPQDRAAYQDFCDYGFYQACDWGGYTNLPAGQWVYVYPHWYIWAEKKVNP